MGLALFPKITLLLPEFRMTNEITVVSYVNFMQAIIANGMGDFKADYTAITAKAGDSAALLDDITRCFLPGNSRPRRSRPFAAVDSIASTNTANRLSTATMLVMASLKSITLLRREAISKSGGNLTRTVPKPTRATTFRIS